ncbi:hypothetical protein [Streptomyces sp. BK340]|uniref:hypothetical protein n=1 Tax=Streptomyces sp. BK340 TaxID=2572903 RepID=UPI0011AC5C37|nr:hypothetical protein [Streptomyces sp. BK340]TVZ84251.1 hypothetical protein FB157_121176 [Streptomyces sp. BK340]
MTRSLARRVAAEAVGTGLLVVVLGLQRTGRARLVPAAVAACIGSAYWFTSSTAFANPAMTIGRVVTDTAAGIAPASAVPFVVAPLLGTVLGLGAATALFGPSTRTGDDAVAPAGRSEPAPL